MTINHVGMRQENDEVLRPDVRTFKYKVLHNKWFQAACVAALVALLLTSIPLVFYGVTGFLQFGYRFSLDVLPFMASLVASGMRCRIGRFEMAVILLSCAINLWGTLAFNKLDWIVWW